MEKVLLIAIPQAEQVEQLAVKQHLRAVHIQPSAYGQSIGQLAGYAVPADAAGTAGVLRTQEQPYGSFFAGAAPCRNRNSAQGSAHPHQPALDGIPAGVGTGAGAPVAKSIRACVHRKYMRIFEQIFLQTRQKFAGILSYGKNFSRSMQQNLPKRRR